MQAIGIVTSSSFKSSPLIVSFVKGISPGAGKLCFPSVDPFGSLQLPSLGGIRWKHSKKVNVNVQKLIPGGINYPGFTYFPRFPDQEDPPCTPTKLFMVKRIRTLFGCPWWEKEWIEKFKLGRMGSVAIVKNTPRNNARLYRVKHLVEITPITTPQGLPDDPKHGFLKENGEFVTYSCIEGHTLQLEEAELKLEELKKKSVDGSTLKNRLKLKWYGRW